MRVLAVCGWLLLCSFIDRSNKSRDWMNESIAGKIACGSVGYSWLVCIFDGWWWSELMYKIILNNYYEQFRWCQIKWSDQQCTNRPSRTNFSKEMTAIGGSIDFSQPGAIRGGKTWMRKTRWEFRARHEDQVCGSGGRQGRGNFEVTFQTKCIPLGHGMSDRLGKYNG